MSCPTRARSSWISRRARSYAWQAITSRPATCGGSADIAMAWASSSSTGHSTVPFPGRHTLALARERSIWEARSMRSPLPRPRSVAAATRRSRLCFSLAQPLRSYAVPPGRQTAWAYCHVPHGSTVDMTERIEAQIERFAPGFRDRILAHHAMAPLTSRTITQTTSAATSTEAGTRYPAAFHPSGRAPGAVFNPLAQALYLLVIHATGRRRARTVRLPCWPGSALAIVQNEADPGPILRVA